MLKPGLRNLICMGSRAHILAGTTPDNAATLALVESYLPGSFGGLTFSYYWSEFQPVAASDFVTDHLDADLALVAAYNVAHPLNPLGILIRIFADWQYAPSWALNLGAGPVTVTNGNTGLPIDLGLYWSHNNNNGFYVAYYNLFDKLGLKYDADPSIQTICLGMPCMISDEQWNEQLGDAASISAVKAKGRTDTIMKGALNDAATRVVQWPSTPLLLNFADFKSIDNRTNSPANQPAPPIATAQKMAAVRGQQGVLSTTTLQAAIGSDNLSIASSFAATGAPIQFQMANGAANTVAVVKQGVALGARAIELFGALPGMTQATLYEMIAAFVVTDPNAADTAQGPAAPFGFPGRGLSIVIRA